MMMVPRSVSRTPCLPDISSIVRGVTYGWASSDSVKPSHSKAVALDNRLTENTSRTRMLA